MTEYISSISPGWIQVCSFSLLHSTWLILVYALVAYILIKRKWANSPSTKTTILLGTLVLSLVSFFGLIYLSIMNGYAVDRPVSSLIEVRQLGISSYTSVDQGSWLLQNEDKIIWLWATGFIIFLSKYICSYVYLVYIKQNLKFDDHPEFKDMIRRVSVSMGYVGKEIKLGYSVLVNSPIVIGWMKPVIVFPIGLINQMSVEQVEAIIAHEISHLIRKDQVFNFLMSIMEILFYFHPAIWWVNSQIKKYREEACDDKVIAAYTDKINYVKTLIRLHEVVQGNNPHLTLAIKNKPSNFYKRIKRLLDMDMNTKNNKTQLLALCSILMIGLLIGHGSLNASQDAEKTSDLTKEFSFNDNVNNEIPQIKFVKIDEERDTIPEKKMKEQSQSKVRISKIDENEEIDIEMEDGEITKLEIDGKEIPEEEYEKYIEQIEDIQGKHHPKVFYFGDDFEFEFPEHFAESFDFEVKIDSMLKRFNFDHEGFKLDSFMHMQFEHKMPEFIHLFPENFQGFDFEFNFPEDGEFFPEQEIEEMLRKLEKEGLMKHQGQHEWEFDEDTHPWFNGDQFHIRTERNLEELIGSQLNKDGFLLPNKENKVILSGKYLKINGEKQPSNIWNKYKSLFEEETGVPLSKKSKLEFSIIGKDYGKRYKAF